MSFSLTIPALGSSARRRLGREFCGLTRRYVQSGAGARLDTPPFPLAPATPYTAPSAPVARPFCTPAFGPRILRPYAPLRADWSGSVSGYGGGRCLLIVREAAAEESFFTFAPRKGDQWIDVALSGDGLIEGHGADAERGPADEAPQVEEGREDQEDHTHEF